MIDYNKRLEKIKNTEDVPDHWKHLSLYEWRALAYAEYIGIVSEYKVRGCYMSIYWNYFDCNKMYTQKEVIDLRTMETKSCETMKRGFKTGWIR